MTNEHWMQLYLQAWNHVSSGNEFGWYMMYKYSEWGYFL